MASGAAPKLDGNQNRQPKILFIMNDLASYKDRLIYLHSQSVVVKAAAEVKNALEIICKELPDVIFISWDLKKVNVKKLYELFSKTHGYLCVVFSEDHSPLRVSALLNSGLPYLLLPPVSGQAMLDKINALIRDRDNLLNNFSRSHMESLPTSGQWEICIKKKGQSPIWRLRHDNEQYFAQANEQPEYDYEEQKWKHINEGCAYKLKPGSLAISNTTTQRNLESSLSLISEVSIENLTRRLSGSNVIDTSLADPKFVSGLESNVIPANTKISDRSKAPDTVIAKSVEVAVELSVERTSEMVKPIEKVTKGTLTLVQTGNFKGYIIGANGDNTTDEELAAKVRIHLGRILDNKGEDVGGDVSVRSLEMDEVPFKIWAEQHAEFIINSQHGDNEVAFAYFNSTTIMERPDGKTEVFKTDIEKGLAADKPVDFDVHLHLPKNKKFVQYLNKGAVLSSEMKNKLISQGIRDVYIKNEQFPDYEVYCAKNEVDASIADFKKMQSKDSVEKK